MRFNLSDYELVQDRIVRFHKTYPNGAIINEVIDTSPDGKRVMVKCSVYKDLKDPIPAGVDIAQDWQEPKGANQTSWCENASTSSTGRALALVIGFKGKGRASAEEMMLAQQRLQQEREVSDFYNEVADPPKEKPKVKPKTIKEEVKEVKEVAETESKEGMSGEDRKKQELFEHVKELKVEYEKQMVAANPDIDTDDSRMKFPPSVYSNMEKCLDTLPFKAYEKKWDQWLGIYNHFNAKKLEKAESTVEELLVDMGVEGTITRDDLPPVDMEEHFSDFPKLNRDIEFKYKVKDISEKQINFISSLAKKREISEGRLKSWILHNFKKTLNALDTKEASMIISCLAV
jgi:hypothetical protein